MYHNTLERVCQSSVKQLCFLAYIKVIAVIIIINIIKAIIFRQIKRAWRAFLLPSGKKIARQDVGAQEILLNQLLFGHVSGFANEEAARDAATAYHCRRFDDS